MANEIKRVYGSAKTLEASGAATNTATAVTADDANYSSSDTNDYPNAIFVLTSAFGSAPTENSIIELLIMPQNVSGSSDVVDAAGSYRPHQYGFFLIDNVSSSSIYYCEAFNIPKEGKAILYNSSGQQMSSGWSLVMIPFTLAPA